jgi:hypothetical protein
MSDQRIRITSRSPAIQRRRVQAQRRSVCCCSLMLLVSLLIVLIAFRGALGRLLRTRHRAERGPQVLFPLELQTPRTWYYRYSLIPVTVRVVDPKGNPQTSPKPKVLVKHDGDAVTTVGDVSEVKLKYDHAGQVWRGRWPLPWNVEEGMYEFEAEVEIDPAQWSWEAPGARRRQEDEERPPEPEGPALCVAKAPFKVAVRRRAEVEPGTCVATWEFGFRERFVGPDGSAGDWRKFFDWVEYVGADTLWYRGGVTNADGSRLTIEQPFKAADLEAIPALAAEAHRRGLKFGTWATAYATYQKPGGRLPEYEYALDISRSTGATSRGDFISLFDDRRVEALAEFFRQMQQEPDVDMVGLDYMRTGRGGYEMVERFTSEMPVKLPEGWEQWSERRQQRYVAVKIEEEFMTDPDFYDHWNWWRAHLGADIVRRIIEKSGIEKPTWIFVLSWWHGKQHGQDPLMFTDVGITMLAPMLYQADDREQFDTFVKHWQEYLRNDQVNLLVGDQVDDYWHQHTRTPPAPFELYDRIVTAHLNYTREKGTVGAFWHDICRAADPTNRGPYSGREWALAGAAAFSKVRDTWGVYPLRVTLEAPNSQTIASTFTVKVNIENVVNREVKGIRVALCDTPRIDPVDPAKGPEGGEPQKTVRGVGPGEKHQVPLQVRISQADGARANRFMIAIRVRWEKGEYGGSVRSDLPRQIVVMKYVKGT